MLDLLERQSRLLKKDIKLVIRPNLEFKFKK